MTPTEPEPSAEKAETPERLDTDVGRAVLRAAETCRQRFDENPSRGAYQLRVILEALGRYPHLIDAVYRFMESDKCPSKVPGAAPVVAIVGVPVRRPVWKEDGSVVFQKIAGRPWEGPAMVETTRWAIDEFDADPLDVAAAVVAHLPPMLRADCRDANKDPAEIGLKIAPLLVDVGVPMNTKRWRNPEAVLRAILMELDHPRPDNLTRK